MTTKYTIVLRLSRPHDNGGIYRAAGVCLGNVGMRTTRVDRRPLPDNDKVLAGHKHAVSLARGLCSNYLFGFANPKQLNKWFMRSERKAMQQRQIDEYGSEDWFMINFYLVREENIGYFRTQIIFKKPAKRVLSLPLDSSIKAIQAAYDSLMNNL